MLKKSEQNDFNTSWEWWPFSEKEQGKSISYRKRNYIACKPA